MGTIASLFPADAEAQFWRRRPLCSEVVERGSNARQRRKLKVSRVAQILKSHRIRRFTADQVVTILREPSLQPAPGAAEAAGEHVLLLLPRLALLNEQIKDVARRTTKLLKDFPQNADLNGNVREHRDVDLLLSLPGLGQTIASTILAEATGPIRERDYGALRCYAGSAPVTKQSGKRRIVSMRRACSERVRKALFHWSGRSIMVHSRSRQHYDRMRAAGHGHARALRGVGDRVLAVLTAILQSGKPHDASLRGISASTITKPAGLLNPKCKTRKH